MRGSAASRILRARCARRGRIKRLQAVADALQKLALTFEENAPMAKHTTLRVGGPADFLIEAKSVDDVRAAFRTAQAYGLPAFLLGSGSNLLVRDGGIRGFAVHLSGAMSAVEVQGTLLRAGAGALLSAAAVAAQQAGLSGLEALSGIPGTCGGAVYMNAGAYGTEIADVLEEVLLLKKDGTLCRARAEELALAYRHSRMMETGEIVLETVFRLVPQARESIAEKMRALAMQRREKQPVTMPSAGSFFKRPPGHFAGALIEQAGLKGTRVGGAQVSTLHAGFLVNAGGATAQDFLGLAALVSEQVLKQSGVQLEPEVQIIGCDLSY
ncbi:MAG TPA: UDP-N-acetylmuramate dehydrogenase [Candidatus Aphodomonas merdavium]|nr:UDP-N-acetylmuramate dehydrogenase [Candidatus Aphodomonas merdavium]